MSIRAIIFGCLAAVGVGLTGTATAQPEAVRSVENDYTLSPQVMIEVGGGLSEGENYMIRERLPYALSPTNIDPGDAHWDSAGRWLTWGPYEFVGPNNPISATPLSFSYNVIGPNGTYSFDGDSEFVIGDALFQPGEDESNAKAVSNGSIQPIVGTSQLTIANISRVYFLNESCHENILASWTINGLGAVVATEVIGDVTPWVPKASTDISGNGVGDLLWQAPDGAAAVWFMNASGEVEDVANWGNVEPWSLRAAFSPSPRRIRPATQFVGPPVSITSTVYWQNPANGLASWAINDQAEFLGADWIGECGDWELRAVGDLTGNGQGDLFWQTPSGEFAIWFMNNDGEFEHARYIGKMGAWRLAAVLDLNNDGVVDLLWQSAQGHVVVHFMNVNGEMVDLEYWGNTRPWRLRTAATVANPLPVEPD